MQNKIKKAGAAYIIMLLVLSVFSAFITPIEAAGDTYWVVRSDRTQIPVGGVFNVTVWLDPGSEDIDSWYIYTFSWNQTPLGCANATSTVISGFWNGDFDDAGDIHNDTGHLANAQSFIGAGTDVNYSTVLVNFTSLWCGALDLRLEHVECQDDAVTVTNTTINQTVYIYPVQTTSLTAFAHNNTTITLSWTSGAGADTTVVRGSQAGYPGSPLSGTAIYNGSGSTTQHTGLTDCAGWYYRAWSWNDTLHDYSLTNATAFGRTNCSTNFTFTGEVPTNNSLWAGNCSNQVAVNVTVRNSAGHTFNWWINCSNGQASSDIGETANTSIGRTMTGLTSYTTYWWNVSVVDSTGVGDNYSESFKFRKGTGPTSPGVPDNPVPPNSAPSIPITVGVFQVDVTDADGDPVNVTFYWANNSRIDNDTVMVPPGTASISPVLSLAYNTTYQWYVIANDTCDTTRGPASGFWSFTTDMVDLEMTKEQKVFENNSILVYINITNDGQTNLTNVLVNENYDTDVTYVSANPTPNVGTNRWIISYLNMTGYVDHTYNITVWVDFSGGGNGTTVINSVNVSHLTLNRTTTAPTLTLCVHITKHTNLSVLAWNSTLVNFTINITNCGDFNLTQFFVNDSLAANYSYFHSSIGTYPNFTINYIKPGTTQSMWIQANTSFRDSGAILINETNVWNNISYGGHEKVNDTITTFLPVGARTERLRVTYFTGVPDTMSVTTLVMGILGVALIISVIMVIIVYIRRPLGPGGGQ